MQRTLATIVLLLLALSACGGGNSHAVGVYRLDGAAFADAMMGGAGANQPEMKAIRDTMVKGIEGSIELKADGTATMRMKMSMMGADRSDDSTGTWKLNGNAVSITAKEKDGKEETRTATLADGALTFEEERDGKKVKMIWRR
jgi:hypothetical protein